MLMHLKLSIHFSDLRNSAQGRIHCPQRLRALETRPGLCCEENRNAGHISVPSENRGKAARKRDATAFHREVSLSASLAQPRARLRKAKTCRNQSGWKSLRKRRNRPSPVTVSNSCLSIRNVPHKAAAPQQ